MFKLSWLNYNVLQKNKIFQVSMSKLNFLIRNTTLPESYFHAYLRQVINKELPTSSLYLFQKVSAEKLNSEELKGQGV